jgi:hypothetical protein
VRGVVPPPFPVPHPPCRQGRPSVKTGQVAPGSAQHPRRPLRRTALPRHQTLRATLDWSYGLLPESERLVLRRVAIFAGAFPLEAAIAIAAGTELRASEVIDCVLPSPKTSTPANCC